VEGRLKSVQRNAKPGTAFHDGVNQAIGMTTLNQPKAKLQS